MNIYTKILKELKKGNAVLARVETPYQSGCFSRLRIITPYMCDFIFDNENHMGFRTSCFLIGVPVEKPKDIIDRMKEYDHAKELSLVSYEVL